jgi:hypothetical protein
MLFGRWTQQRFYLAIQRRLRRLLQDASPGSHRRVPASRADGLVVAPSGAAPRHLLERLARASVHPGR